MRAKRYPSYRDSDVAWLGELPAHWRVDRIKASVESCKNGIWGDEPQGGEDDLICVRVADFDRGALSVQLENPTIRNVSEKERGQRVLKRGNLLIEKSGGGEKQPVGAVVLYDHDAEAVCSNFVAKMEIVEGFWPRFWLYVHAAAYAVGLNHRSINQTSGIQNLDQARYFEERAPFPPIEEQIAIATFLDRETAKIDALVQDQRRLIALLREKRQAVVSHAVTKGLDPNVRMKDSGTEWLGEMPAHWVALQLGRLCRQVADGPHFSPAYLDDGVMFLSARNIRVESWSLDDAKYISEEDYLEFCKRVVPEIGDVLYTKGGTTGIARAVDLSERFQVWVHVAVLKLHRDRVDPYFLAYALNSAGCYAQAQLHTRGATNQDLGLTRMTRIWLCLPPMAEQLKLIAHLNDRTAGFDELVAQADRAIGLLQERRAALIFAAVTGKIDIRDQSAQATNMEAA